MFQWGLYIFTHIASLYPTDYWLADAIFTYYVHYCKNYVFWHGILFQNKNQHFPWVNVSMEQNHVKVNSESVLPAVTEAGMSWSSTWSTLKYLK